MTAKEIYEKHWRGWVEANYGKKVAGEADFKEVEHDYIIAAMEEYAGTTQKSYAIEFVKWFQKNNHSVWSYEQLYDQFIYDRKN